MKKLIALFVVIFVLFSCKKDDEIVIRYAKKGAIVSKEYISNGNYIDSVEFYEKGIIVRKIFFKKPNRVSCYVKDYDSTGLISEGNTVKKIKVGKWKIYDSEKRIRKVIEFKNVCNEEYPNQEWNYDKHGAVKPVLSTYFTYEIGKPISIEGIEGRNLKIHYKPMSEKDAICTINLSSKINDDFCNVDLVKKWSIKSDQAFTFLIPIESQDLKKGVIVRGYIEEHHFEDINEKISNHKSRRVYVDLLIRV